MGFELAIPLLFLGLAGMSLWGMLYYARNPSPRYRLATVAAQHGFAILAMVFIIVATISAKYVVDYENVGGNANLTNISDLLDVVFRAELALFSIGFALAFIFFIVRGILLLKKIKLERIREKEEAEAFE